MTRNHSSMNLMVKLGVTQSVMRNLLWMRSKRLMVLDNVNVRMVMSMTVVTNVKSILELVKFVKEELFSNLVLNNPVHQNVVKVWLKISELMVDGVSVKITNISTLVTINVFSRVQVLLKTVLLLIHSLFNKVVKFTVLKLVM